MRNAILLLLLSCSASPTRAVRSSQFAELELLVHDERLVLVSSRIAPPPTDEGSGNVRYEYIVDGDVTRSGLVEMRAGIRHEWEEGFSNQSAGGLTSIRVTVPLKEGDIHLRNGDVILTTHFDGLPDVTSLSFAGAADVIEGETWVGGPTLVRGQGTIERRFNLLFVSEGYTRDELIGFRERVEELSGRLLARAPFASFRDSFNIWRQDAVSQETGIAAANEVKSTAFNVTLGDGVRRPERCALPASTWSPEGMRIMQALRSSIGADVVVVLANTEERIGCAYTSGSFIVVGGADAVSITDALQHELGHALFNLADEYGGSGQECAHGPNLTGDLSSIPWQDKILPGTSIPTSPDSSAVGAYEGGGYCDQGVWRPQRNCLMRELRQPMCSVCFAEARRIITERTTTRHLLVTNRADEDIWVRCPGEPSSTCSTWLPLPPNTQGELALQSEHFEIRFQRDIVLVRTAKSDVSVYWNPNNWLEPRSTFLDSQRNDAGTSAAPRCHLVINEVQVDGMTMTDEFVELYNPCSEAISLDGVELQHHASSAARGEVAATLHGTLDASGFYLLGGRGYVSSRVDAILERSLSSTGDALALSAAGVAIDVVAWGAYRGGAVEHRSALAPLYPETLGRMPNGHDEDNNRLDFAATVATPGLPNR